MPKDQCCPKCETRLEDSDIEPGFYEFEGETFVSLTIRCPVSDCPGELFTRVSFSDFSAFSADGS